METATAADMAAVKSGIDQMDAGRWSGGIPAAG
jgi:hypothetical protein